MKLQLLQNQSVCSYCTTTLCVSTVSISAPSAPPSAVTVTSVSSSTLTIQWGDVPCIHQNGKITGYTIQYGATGSGDKQTVKTSETEVTLSSLTPETNYEISVAAVNTEGTGVSENISATTSAGSWIHTYD